MKRIHYNKLIRDKIPDKMDRRKVAYRICCLKQKEFAKELVKKVEEEGRGLRRVNNRKQMILELADVVAVVNEIKKVFKIKKSELDQAIKANQQCKGGFKKRLYLYWTEKGSYWSNEQK